MNILVVVVRTYRAARRILDRVSSTRQTSRLLRRPYSPTSFNSESLYIVHCQFAASLRLEQRQAHVSVAGDTDNRAASKGRRGTREVLEYDRLEKDKY